MPRPARLAVTAAMVVRQDFWATAVRAALAVRAASAAPARTPPRRTPTPSPAGTGSAFKTADRAPRGRRETLDLPTGVPAATADRKAVTAATAESAPTPSSRAIRLATAAKAAML